MLPTMHHLLRGEEIAPAINHISLFMSFTFPVHTEDIGRGTVCKKLAELGREVRTTLACPYLSRNHSGSGYSWPLHTGIALTDMVETQSWWQAIDS